MLQQKLSEQNSSRFIVIVQKFVSYPSSFFRKELIAMLGILALLCVIVFHKFISGYSVYLFKDIGSDTLNAFYPSFVHIAEILWKGSIPGWSFEQGLGQNVFPFSLNDPTVYLLYLLGGKNLSFGIIWVEIFKILGSGLLFFLLLKKIGVGAIAGYTGGLLYAFSGFMIIGGSWYGFSTLGLYLALMLFSFELLYSEDKWWLFPISISLIATQNFVSLYTCSLFLFSYVLFKVFGDEKVNLKKLPPLFSRMLALGMLGVLISSVFSIPNLLQMLDSPRVLGASSQMIELASIPIFELGNAHYLITLLMRTFSSDLLGNGNDYKGWGNYLEAPLSYCGLITLLLAPQMFTFLKARQKLVYGIFIGIFIFAEIFPWFRRGFWLFQGDYFRDISLHVSIIFILFSALALDRIVKGRQVNLLLLGVSFFTLMILLYFPYDISILDKYKNIVEWPAINEGIRTKIALFLAVLSATLFLFTLEKYGKYAVIFLLVITFTELAIFTNESVGRRDVVDATDLNKKIGYNDYSVEAIAFIKQQDKDFFRIEKNYGSSPAILASLNDSMVQHYFGSSSYVSFNQTNYINFLKQCDILNSKMEIVGRSRWVIGVKNTPALHSLIGIKYYLFKGDWVSHPTLTKIYNKIGQFGDVAVLKSDFALPMGVAYDTYIVQSDFNKLDTARKHIALLKAVMIPDSLAPELSDLKRIAGSSLPSGGAYLPEELTIDTTKLKSNSLHINFFSSNAIDGEINTKTTQLLFFSFPFDNGWKATINGKTSTVYMVDGGLSAILVKPGENVITLRYSPPYVKYGLYLTMLGVLIFGVLAYLSAGKLAGQYSLQS